ncbi:MAG: rod shape-determining protein RodA [Deltaproteobacteria bacterium]|nr:MAG: rod shape-determining protein RodA [Deltaproteobacteria bacterium]
MMPRGPTVGPPRTLLGRLSRNVDWVIVVITLSLLVLAFINLNSAAPVSFSRRIVTQFGWCAVGVTAMFAVSLVDPRTLYTVAYAAYGVGVALLVMVAFLGYTAKGAGRWLVIGSSRFQPSELMKILLILALARYLHGLPRHRHTPWRNLLQALSMVAVPVVLVVRQPDLGTGIFLSLVALSMLAVTELRLKSLLAIGSSGVLALALMWRYGMLNYQRLRIDVWLDPELYADDEGYQTIQAMISVGNGGFFGRGVGEGTQNVLRFLPERLTDFPFAIFAEEWGFVGCAVVLLLYASLVLWSLHLASRARDRFRALLAIGVGALFFWHVVINVGMVLQLFPVVGITLPFFSLGGSNLLTMLIALGILMSVSRSRLPG